MTAWQIRSFPGLNLPNLQTKQSSSAEQIPHPTRPQSRDYPECLVLIINCKLLIVGSGWVEIVSLCLINTYLIMVNYYCLIIEEQSCQSPDMKKPSGSLITICWHLAPGWAVRGPETGRCLHCVIPPSTDSWVNTHPSTFLWLLYCICMNSAVQVNVLHSMTKEWWNNPENNKSNIPRGAQKKWFAAIMPACPC